MANKHPKSGDQPIERKDDLERDPGIGQSKGLFGRGSGGRDEELIEGDATVEGDVENDAGLGQGAGTGLGRTND